MALLFVILLTIRLVIGKICYYCNLDFLPGEYCSPIMIALAVNVFLMFRKMKISGNRFISFFASSAVSVYLISEYPAIRTLLTSIFQHVYTDYCKNSFIGLVFIVMYGIAIFVSCTLIDKIRKLIQDKLESIIFRKI